MPNDRNWGGRRDGAGRRPSHLGITQYIKIRIDPVKWQTLHPLIHHDIDERGEFIYNAYLEEMI